MIFNAMGIPVAHQTLVHRGEEVPNELRLIDKVSNLDDMLVIFLVIDSPKKKSFPLPVPEMATSDAAIPDPSSPGSPSPVAPMSDSSEALTQSFSVARGVKRHAPPHGP